MISAVSFERASALFRWIPQIVMNPPNEYSRSLPKLARGIASPIHFTDRQ